MSRALAMCVYFGFARWVERREVTELLLPGMAKEMGIGLLIGAGLYAGCILILMIMGIYRMDGFNPVYFMVPAIASALSSGFLEELLTGGQFGLEASLTAFLLCTTTGVIMLVMAVRKGNVVQPFWKRKAS